MFCTRKVINPNLISRLRFFKPESGFIQVFDSFFIFSYCLSACNYRLKPATKKIIAKATVATAPSIKTVTTPKPTPVQQNVVVKRPTGAIVNVSTSKPNVIPKPVLKFTSSSKVSFPNPGILKFIIPS